VTDAVDLERYPINDPGGAAYQNLVQTCREQLRSDGVAQLAGFLTEAAISQMLALASELAGQAWVSDQTLRLPGRPGTLAVFRGQHALHRVTPVAGPRPRINSVLTYGERPGMKLSELTQQLFYGRTA
jgi:hypothetical protein